jgi:hypothetical protein
MQAKEPLNATLVQSDRVNSLALADHEYLDNLLNMLPDAYKKLSGWAAVATSSPSTVLVVAEAQRQGRPTGLRDPCQSDDGTVRAEMKSFAERNPFYVGVAASG